MKEVTLQVPEDAVPSGERIRDAFLDPLRKLVKKHKLGIFDYMDKDMTDRENSLEFSVYSATDDYGNCEFSACVYLRVDGTAEVRGYEDGKILLRGTWLEACKWVADFYTEEGRKQELAREYLAKLENAGRALA